VRSVGGIVAIDDDDGTVARVDPLAGEDVGDAVAVNPRDARWPRRPKLDRGVVICTDACDPRGSCGPDHLPQAIVESDRH
jgi:hypothetical protein